MTTQHEPRDEFDCEEIERDLKEISPWPWFSSTNYLIGGFWVQNKELKEKEEAISDLINNEKDAYFISKSPQRLAAAVRRIKALEEEVAHLKKRHAQGCDCPGCKNKWQMKLQGQF